MKTSIICNLLIFYKTKMLRNAATHSQSKRDNFLKFGFFRNIHKPQNGRKKQVNGGRYSQFVCKAWRQSQGLNTLIIMARADVILAGLASLQRTPQSGISFSGLSGLAASQLPFTMLRQVKIMFKLPTQGQLIFRTLRGNFRILTNLQSK